MSDPRTSLSSRRRFLQATAATAAGVVLPRWRLDGAAPAIVTSNNERPQVLQGLQLGDPADRAVVVWSRTDRPARMIVEWSRDERFRTVKRIAGPTAGEAADFTVRRLIDGLEAEREVFVRVSFESLGKERATSEPVSGRFTVPPNASRGAGWRSRPGTDGLRFVWGADTAGQGWGINPDFGGMKIYEAMRRRHPLFFIHTGDTIYADGPIAESVTTGTGAAWKNIVTPQVSKVAETLDEFRGRYRYNMLDDNVRRFNAEVPQIWQWDDHEVMNNWSSSKDLSADGRYTEKNVQLLVERGRRAFLEYAPMRPFGRREPQRVYRRYSYGPLLDVFVIDMRSYRGPNTANLQITATADTAFLGPEQLGWLKAGLANSRAAWKVIASDMPIGLNVGDGKTPDGQARWEAVANGEAGPPKGREMELADLLGHLKRARVRNVIWLTGDVHYAAAHYYNSAKAAFTDFDGFWEFVAGPLNAGTFGPDTLDGTFGPEVAFVKAPPKGQSNLSPLSGLQFFGEINIDAPSGDLTVDLRDINGASVFSKTLQARTD